MKIEILENTSKSVKNADVEVTSNKKYFVLSLYDENNGAIPDQFNVVNNETNSCAVEEDDKIKFMERLAKKDANQGTTQIKRLDDLKDTLVCKYVAILYFEN